VPIFKFKTYIPHLSRSAWIAHDANIIGKIKIMEKASVWFGATLRGDNEEILVGEGSNIQENCVLHTDHGFPLKIGKNCTIGHSVILHGCSISDNTLIGMGSTILNGAQIGKGCLIGAGSLITENKIIPDGSLVMGSPGKVMRELDHKAKESLIGSALHYQERAAEFSKHLDRLS
jgi:carbonic anhydrase/acetyltransferase-like protein (isoleucine patch superfamily)